MTKVLVLGGTGMLGLGVQKALEGSRLEVLISTRRSITQESQVENRQVQFDALTSDVEDLSKFIGQGDFIINCIGIIKPHIKDDNPVQRRMAMEVNGIFPDELATFAQSNGIKVIQIATDCVYSGLTGDYDEDAPFDAFDVYGKTKSLGEVPADSMMHLRVSIIGTEAGRSTSLWEWVRNQPKNSKITGFTDHAWNGVTTFHFGKLARGIIERGLFKPVIQHVVPSGELTKFELVSLIAEVSGRRDIQIEPKPSGKPINRTLKTSNPTFNKEIWEAAGYLRPPTVPEMIREFPLD